ncbi:MAG: DUF111 family protein, partial [Pseudomonadales bacterium]|nr:DUF111 family protein [Pseudomonadales bacterium]
YLSPIQAGGRGKLTGTGFGFGTKRFPGISNVVRVLAFEDTDTDTPWDTDEIIELAFEVDDETPEELAHSIEMIRGTSGVLDVTCMAVMGKKGRTSFSLRILARPEAENHVITSCFEQTTTLGIRRVRTERAILPRQEREVHRDGLTLRIKTAERPGDRTTKAESDDINQARTTLAARRRLRREVETDNGE